MIRLWFNHLQELNCISYNSFYPSTLRFWNSLPQELKENETLQAFRALSKYMTEYCLITLLVCVCVELVTVYYY